MPFQAVAQGEAIGLLVFRQGHVLDHLRLWLEVLVERIERVVDHEAVHLHEVGGRAHRVEHLEVGARHHLQRSLGKRCAHACEKDGRG
ncbi:hypothetical protein Q1M63_01280 (plasmid) [Sinorhizobium meliloti]|nr:hypothetical protein Q1M63_01280 [Sinorhizobium meliloti]